MPQLPKATKEGLEKVLVETRNRIEELKAEIKEREKELKQQHENFYEITSKIYNREYAVINKGADQ